MKGTVCDIDGHIIYKFDNEHDYSKDLKDGETIQSFDYVDINAPEIILQKRIIKLKNTATDEVTTFEEVD